MRKTKLFVLGACGAALLFALVALAGCSSSASEEWACEQDASLDVLTKEASDGSTTAYLGDAWAVRDGYIQLQLSGGSIPGWQVESVLRDGDVLTVTASKEGDIETMDLMLVEYRLTGPGDASEIKAVKVDWGKGDVQEAQQLEPQA